MADPDTAPGVGVLLMRRLLAGPQELTITDGATDAVQAMWDRLSGSTAGVACLGWTRVFRPGRLGAELASRRLGKPLRGPVGGRAMPGDSSDVLAPELLIEGSQRLRARLRPAYDLDFLRWLFGEMEAVQDRGPLARRVVRNERGAMIGWYVAYLPPGRIAQTIAIGSLRPDAGPVIEALFADARAASSSAVQGRVDPGILPALTARRCFFRRTEWALVHYRDDRVAVAAGREQTALTRLDGEWWMDYHLRVRSPTAQG